MKTTKIFLDTEFTGLHQETTLVSLGLISECGKTFYAEFTDYDVNQVDNWLKENVLNNLLLNSKEFHSGSCYRLPNQFADVLIKGDVIEVGDWLYKWLSEFEKVEMWSDCLAYDWVLFNQIWGHASCLPDNVGYIPFDICTLFKIKNIDPDINREIFAYNIAPIDCLKHNALYDPRL